MEKDFEQLISSFIKNNIGIDEHFLSEKLAGELKINLLALHDKKLLLTAGIGNNKNLSHNSAIRSDMIFWLDKKNNNIHENAFFLLIEDFIRYLNHSCYAGITGYEFHYSLYEAGTFYKRHLDQFNNNSDRKYSLISYLNNNWKEADGGELLIHHADSDHSISPTQGKTVFFKSNELAHQVLVTNKTRMSITGWLKSD